MTVLIELDQKAKFIHSYFLLPMKMLLISCFLALAILPASAENPYSIDLMGTGSDYLFHDGGWQRGTECIEAKVSTKQLLKRENMVIKAYFYGDTAEPVHTSPQPSSRATGNGNSMTKPMEIAKGKKQEFSFGIPSDMLKGSKKWRRVVVVFGDKSTVTARVYPKDDLTNFNFPEKHLIKQ